MIFENITVLYMDLPQELQLKKKNNTNLPINVIIPNDYLYGVYYSGKLEMLTNEAKNSG